MNEEGFIHALCRFELGDGGGRWSDNGGGWSDNGRGWSDNGGNTPWGFLFACDAVDGVAAVDGVDGGDGVETANDTVGDTRS